FDEDALRILRAVRFSSSLSFTVEENTKNAVFARKSLLSSVSVERIREEFDKILLGDGCENALISFKKVIAVFIPEISPCFGFDQRTKYHEFDVYTHIVKTVANVPKNRELRLAAFFHDAGKPSRFTLDGDGNGHFYGHPKASRDIAETVLYRLKYPKSLINEVLTLVEYHDAPIIPKDAAGNYEKYVLRALNKFGEKTLSGILALKRADNYAKRSAKPSSLPEAETCEKLLKELIEKKACFGLKDLAVKGGDITRLGAKGRAVGETLEYLLSLVISGDAPNEREILTEKAEKFLSGR
ncbi:MAG: HD domain-containing protein, partial [Clostridia bacterium]|nr:HD domain-containing protein [Clostridia bacterium]